MGLVDEVHIYEFCLENITGVNLEIGKNTAVQESLFLCFDCSLLGDCSQLGQQDSALFSYPSPSLPHCSFPSPLHPVTVPLALHDGLLAWANVSVAAGKHLKNTSWAPEGDLQFQSSTSALYVLCLHPVSCSPRWGSGGTSPYSTNTFWVNADGEIVANLSCPTPRKGGISVSEPALVS